MYTLHQTGARELFSVVWCAVRVSFLSGTCLTPALFPRSARQSPRHIHYAGPLPMSPIPLLAIRSLHNGPRFFNGTDKETNWIYTQKLSADSEREKEMIKEERGKERIFRDCIGMGTQSGVCDARCLNYTQTWLGGVLSLHQKGRGRKL